MKRIHILLTAILALYLIASCDSPKTLWELANEKKDVLTISTIFPARAVHKYLSTEQGIDSAITWCKDAGITRVFIEGFRGGYTVERQVLENARDRFKAAGIEASGGITTTRIAKPSTNGTNICCFTNTGTREELQKTMEYLASMFDVIMVDDFLFTHCECEECLEACGDRRMSEYRCDLMVDVSLNNMLLPSKAVNPNVKLINKYPRWYDSYHRRGYEVIRQTRDFDIIWVGTETRDSDFSRFDRGWEITQYESYFIMRWLTDIGGEKTGGGWYDALGTTPTHYLEQGRQTVLADVKEIMLFSYGGLIRETNNYGNREGTGIANLEAFKKELPDLFKLAEIVQDKPITGIQVPKPANSDPAFDFDSEKGFLTEKTDAFVYDFIGMMGLPLVPVESIDPDAKASFLSLHALKDREFQGKFSKMVAESKPLLITEALAEQLENIDQYENVIVLDTRDTVRNLLKYDRERLNQIRDKMMAPFEVKFDAPNSVAFYLMGDGIYIMENFNNSPVDASIEANFTGNETVKLILPADGEVEFTASKEKLEVSKLSPRTLVVFQ
ncbi:hypothetical protein ACFLU5_09925 [Bacteroidota bacterium]